MYLIIVGAGAAARSLVSLATEAGHRVSVIEKDEKLAQTILQQYDVQVFQSDIAENSILDEAEAAEADAIVATTSDDSVNLMAMFLGKERGIKNLVALIQNSKHQAMFEELGAQVLADPERLIAERLFDFVKSNHK